MRISTAIFFALILLVTEVRTAEVASHISAAPDSLAVSVSAHNVSRKRLWAYWGFMASAESYAVYRLRDLWYSSPTTSFHFFNPVDDWKHFKQMDKLGHAMHSYFATRLSIQAYQWAGMSGENALRYGWLTGFLWMFQIEMADAFFADWGFSLPDLLANLGGSLLAYQQYRQGGRWEAIRLKISYQPSAAYHEGRYSDINDSVIDDYEGMTFWLALNPAGLLPERLGKSIPNWLAPLGFAVGYNAKGIAGNHYGGRREIFLGLDVDLNRLQWGKKGLPLFLFNQLNLVRLPLPAVRFTPGAVWYGIYF